VELGKNINILTQCVLDNIVSLCLMYLLIFKVSLATLHADHLFDSMLN